MSTTNEARNAPLPRDGVNQAYISVKTICAGEMFLPDEWLYRDCKDVPWDQGATVPDFSFLLTHPTKGKAMFDLGIRKVTLQ